MFQGLLRGAMQKEAQKPASASLQQGLSAPIGVGKSNLEKRIVEMMLADYAWEQVIYDIVASEGLDPWNLDLNALSSSFLSYMGKIKELDFRIPAKYVIISSVILRMKSDGLRLLDIPTDNTETDAEDDFAIGQTLPFNMAGIDTSMFDMHGRRRPTKPIMVTDLVRTLKKMLNAQQIKDMKIAAAQSTLKFSTESITDRINSIYNKINSMLSKIKADEVEFSKIVEKWERKSVVEHFLPLVYLDNENKVNCRQENFFDEIYIRKVGEISNSNGRIVLKENGNGLSVKQPKINENSINNKKLKRKMKNKI